MSEPSKQPAVFRLANAYPNLDTSNEVRIQADVSKEDYDYLFRRVLAGQARGVQASILTQLFSKFVNALRVSSPTIPEHFDDDNDSRVAKVLSRCSFDEPNREASNGNVGGRTPGVRSGDKKPKDKSPDTKGRTRRGKSGDREESTEEKEGVAKEAS